MSTRGWTIADEQGRSWALDDGTVTFGSDPAARVVLAGPGVQPAHLRAVAGERGVTLVTERGAATALDVVTHDRNGRVVKTESREITGRCGVMPGDRFSIGPTRFRVEAAPAPPGRAGDPPWTLTGRNGATTSRTFAIDADRLVGRVDDCDIVLKEGHVSRRHAWLRRRGGELWVQDLASANGTFVNGERIQGAMRLLAGDDVTFDEFTFAIHGPVDEPEETWIRGLDDDDAAAPAAPVPPAAPQIAASPAARSGEAGPAAAASPPAAPAAPSAAVPASAVPLPAAPPHVAPATAAPPPTLPAADSPAPVPPAAGPATPGPAARAAVPDATPTSGGADDAPPPGVPLPRSRRRLLRMPNAPAWTIPVPEADPADPPPGGYPEGAAPPGYAEPPGHAEPLAASATPETTGPRGSEPSWEPSARPPSSPAQPLVRPAAAPLPPAPPAAPPPAPAVAPPPVAARLPDPPSAAPASDWSPEIDDPGESTVVEGAARAEPPRAEPSSPASGGFAVGGASARATVVMERPPSVPGVVRPGTARLPVTDVAEAEPKRHAALVGLSGPVAGALFRLRGGRITIGRSPECDLVIDENSVSSRHAQLVIRADGAKVFNLISANGIFVNGDRVNSADLNAGDVIQLGRVELRYEPDADAVRMPSGIGGAMPLWAWIAIAAVVVAGAAAAVLLAG